jgi:hypothetical protein
VRGAKEDAFAVGVGEVHASRKAKKKGGESQDRPPLFPPVPAIGVA